MTRVRQVMYDHVKKKIEAKQSCLRPPNPFTGAAVNLAAYRMFSDKHWTSVSLPVVSGDNSHVF